MNLLEIIGVIVLAIFIFCVVLWSLGMLTINVDFEIDRDE